MRSAFLAIGIATHNVLPKMPTGDATAARTSVTASVTAVERTGATSLITAFKQRQVTTPVTALERGQLSCLKEQNPVAPALFPLGMQPAAPRAGSLFRIAIANAALTGKATTLIATVAGEPLHWHVIGDSLIAIAAAPVDSVQSVPIELHCENGAAQTIRIQMQSGAYPLERLQVAPQFSAPPDSALSERLRREGELAADVSRASHRTPKLWAAPFVAPRTARITSGFGGGRMFNGTVTSRHMGTDYAGAVGAPVRAANRGVVRLIGAFYLGGNVIYIDHGEGVVTAYLHLSRQRVAVGDTVQQGMVIGDVGATGRVTGPHLHFIARYGGITVDALSLLRMR